MKKTTLTHSFATLRTSLLVSCLLGATQAVSFAVVGADGNTWRNTDSGTTANYDQISVVNDNFVVASAGSGATLSLYQNGSWQEFTGWGDYKANNEPFGAWGNTERMYVSAVSETEIWIGSYANQGNNVRWDGSTFTAYGRGTSRRVRAMDAFAREDGSTVVTGMTRLGGASSNAMVGSYRYYTDAEGVSNNTIVSTQNDPTILGVSAYSAENIWAVGGNYLFRSVNHGNAYTQYDRPAFASGNVSAVYAFDAQSAIAGTADGNLFLWNEVSGFGEQLLWDFDFGINSIYATDADNIWVVGNSGNLWFFDGNIAQQIDIGITSNLVSIDGTGADNIWIAGTNGQIWTTTIPEPSYALLGVAAFVGCIYLKRRR